LPGRNYDYLPPIRVDKCCVARCFATLEIADPSFDAANNQAFPVMCRRREMERESAIRWQADENFESFHWNILF
jgi:hypothetical protein